jgi:formylmethanofuran dehydrogenase subunit E
METKIEFNLLQTDSEGRDYSVRNGLPSIQAAKELAAAWNTRVAHQFKIQQVTTTRQTVEIFTTEAASPPSRDEIAGNMSCVYAQSIDWEDEDFLALSPEDQAKVRDSINQDTDECQNCGWSFESHYLSDTDHGLICDRCENDLAEEDEEDED